MVSFPRAGHILFYSLSWSTAVPSPLTQEKEGGGNPEAVQGRVTVAPSNTSRSEVGCVRIVGGVTERDRGRGRGGRVGKCLMIFSETYG